MSYTKLPNVKIRNQPPDAFSGDAVDLVASVREDWKGNKAGLRTRVFNDGISNALIGVFKDGTPDDMVLVRVYGNSTDKFIDRDAEIRNMEAFHANGLAPPIYAAFANGIAYGFIPGRIVDKESARDPLTVKMIAEMTAKMHKMPLGTKKESRLWSYMRLLLGLCPDGPEAFAEAKRAAGKEVPDMDVLKRDVLTRDSMAEEVSVLERELSSCDSPVVFSHNDLLHGNIVITADGDSGKEVARFIDYEYGCPNYAAFDIGNHFNEAVGLGGTLDYDKDYPDEKLQRLWVRHYLEAYTGKESVSDSEVEKVRVIANKFALCSHLFWGIWGLVQATVSDIDFDFLDYQAQRFREYFKRKDELLLLKA